MASDIAHWHMADVVGLIWHYPISACGPCGRAWHIDVVDCVAHWCGWLRGTMWALHNLKAEGELNMLISGLTVLGIVLKLKPFMGPHGVRYAIILRWVKAQDWLETCFITCQAHPSSQRPTTTTSARYVGLSSRLDKHLGFTWGGIMGEGLVVNDHVVQVVLEIEFDAS